MATIGSLNVKLTVNGTEFSGQIAAAGKSVQQFGNQADKSLGGFSASGAAAFGLAAGAASALGSQMARLAGSFARSSITIGSDFEKAMSKVKAMAGAGESEFTALRNAALEAGRSSGFGAAQAAESESALLMAGFQTHETLKALNPTIQLAAAGQISLAESADITARALRGFGLDAEKTQGVVDAIAVAANASNMSVTDMGESLKFIAPTAAAGKSLEETSAALMVLADAGIRGEMGGTALRNIMMKMSDRTDEAKRMMAAFNIEFADAQGNIKHVADIIDHLQERLSSLNREQKLNALGTLFEARAATGMLAMLNRGGGAIRIAQSQVNEGVAGGAAAKAQATMMDNLSGDYRKLQGATESLGIAFSEISSGPLRSFTQSITSIVRFGENIIREASGTKIKEAVKPDPRWVRPAGSVIGRGPDGPLAALNSIESLRRLRGQAGQWPGTFATAIKTADRLINDLEEVSKVPAGQTIDAEKLRHIAFGIYQARADLKGALAESTDEKKLLESPRFAAEKGVLQRYLETLEQLDLQALELNKEAFEAEKKLEAIGAAAAAAKTASLLDVSKWSDFRGQVKDLTSSFEAQIASFGKTAQEAEYLRLELTGLKAASSTLVAGELAPLRELQESARLASGVRQLWEQTRTPLDQFDRQVQDLQSSLQRGFIGWDLYERAVTRAGQALTKTGSSATPALLEGSAGAISAINSRMRSSGSSVEQAIREGRDIQRRQEARLENAEKLLRQILQALIPGNQIP